MSTDFEPAVTIKYFASYRINTPGDDSRVQSYNYLENERQDAAAHEEAQRAFDEFADSAQQFGRVTAQTDRDRRIVGSRHYWDLGFDTSIITDNKLLIAEVAVAIAIIKGSFALIGEMIKKSGRLTIKHGKDEIVVSSPNDLEAAVRALERMRAQSDAAPPQSKR